MRQLVTIACILCGYVLKAQDFKTNHSYMGYAITHTDTIFGKISLNLQANQVLLKKDNSFVNFSVRDLKKVLIEKHGQEYIYYSAPFGINNEPFLFRALSDGKLPLLYREGIKFNKYEEDVLPPYFVLIVQQVFTLGEKKEIIGLFTDHRKDIQTFIKSENIKLKSEEDLIRVFNHYNSLGEPGEIPSTDG